MFMSEREQGFAGIVGHPNEYFGIGSRLEYITRQAGEEAILIWKDIQQERKGASFTEEDYRNFYAAYQDLAPNANLLIHGTRFSRSESPPTRYLGQILVISQVLGPIFQGVDKLRQTYPEAEFNTEEMIENRIARAWTSLVKAPGYRQYPEILRRISRSTFSDGERQILGDRYEEVLLSRRAQRKEDSEVSEEVIPQQPTAEQPAETPRSLQEKWQYWLQLAKYGGVAAVVVLGLIAAFNIKTLEGAGISDIEAELKSSGIQLQWIQKDPIDPRKSLWAGDGEPLVPSQVKSRKTLGIGTEGVKLQTLEETRVPIIMKGSNGKTISAGEYANDPLGRIVSVGNQYTVELERGKPSRVLIDCRDENYQTINLLQPPVSKVVAQTCEWAFPVAPRRIEGVIYYDSIGAGIRLKSN